MNVHKLFGVTYMIKSLESMLPPFRYVFVKSIIYAANAGVRDLVGGCIETLLSKIQDSLIEL